MQTKQSIVSISLLNNHHKKIKWIQNESIGEEFENGIIKYLLYKYAYQIKLSNEQANKCML